MAGDGVGPPGSNGPIGLPDFSLCKKAVHSCEGLASAGEDSHPTHRPVEPVNNTEKHIARLAVSVFDVSLDHIAQGRIASLISMNQDASRLVHGNKMVIFVNDFHGKFLQDGKNMKLTLGFSPCPNDTFIFDALVHGKINTEGLTFDVVMDDVEELNRLAFAQKLDVTKLSYHAYAHIIDRYALLDAGSALGKNCGPILIAKHEMDKEQIQQAKIAIPGKYTTANLLLSLAYPAAVNKIPFLFSDIEEAVMSGEVDAGLIIHENRFTYMDNGLIKIIDLGEYWESTYKMPIPLGGIAIRRSLKKDVQHKLNSVLRASVEYALKNPDDSYDFVRENAQEMEGYIMHSHIKLYVNDFTVNLGKAGRSAIYKLFEVGRDKYAIPTYEEKIFLN